MNTEEIENMENQHISIGQDLAMEYANWEEILDILENNTILVEENKNSTTEITDKELNAIANYAIFFKLPLDSVSLEQVVNSCAGIDGWYEEEILDILENNTILVEENKNSTTEITDKELNAMANYAIFFKLPLDSVSLEQVVNSCAGIDGWYEYILV